MKTKKMKTCKTADGTGCGYTWKTRTEVPKQCPFCNQWQDEWLKLYRPKETK